MITYLQILLTPGEILGIGEPFGRLHEIKFDDHYSANLERVGKNYEGETVEYMHKTYHV